MHAWQFAKAQYLADQHGWTRFVSMQNYYNLLYREEERGHVALLPRPGRWLDFRGALGSWASGPSLGRTDPIVQKRTTWAGTSRTTNRTVSSSRPSSNSLLIEASRPRKSRSRGYSPSRSLPVPSWARPKDHHLADAVAAIDVTLDEAEIATLEASYVPRPVTGINLKTTNRRNVFTSAISLFSISRLHSESARSTTKKSSEIKSVSMAATPKCCSHLPMPKRTVKSSGAPLIVDAQRPVSGHDVAQPTTPFFA